MKIDLLSDLACPAALAGKRCQGALVMAPSPAPRCHLNTPEEMIEALLTCETCGATYPVLCGIAILVPDTTSYLQRHYKTILSLALEHELGVSPAMLTYLHQMGAHTESANRAGGGEDSPRALSSYLRAHYDTQATLLPHLPEEHLLSSFSNNYQQRDLYNTLLAMFTPHLTANAKIIDIGCHVGRLTRELAALEYPTIGLDTSFTAVFFARRAVCGWPTPLNEYEYFSDGLKREMRPLHLPVLKNSEVLVASAMQLPFKPAIFQAAISANVIDILPEPLALLREMRLVLVEAGLMALSTPYHTGASAATARWLGPDNHMSVSQALRWRIGHHFDIVDERDYIPWVLGEHERRIQIYLNHCLVGRKSPTSKTP